MGAVHWPRMRPSPPASVLAGSPEESLKTWDCSELVQHLLAQVGVEQVTDSGGRVTPINVFDGAGFQWERSRSIPFEDGVKLLVYCLINSITSLNFVQDALG